MQRSRILIQPHQGTNSHTCLHIAALDLLLFLGVSSSHWFSVFWKNINHMWVWGCLNVSTCGNGPPKYIWISRTRRTEQAFFQSGPCFFAYPAVLLEIHIFCTQTVHAQSTRRHLFQDQRSTKTYPVMTTHRSRSSTMLRTSLVSQK